MNHSANGHRPTDARLPRVSRRAVKAAARCGLVLMLVLTLGLHWALLQTVAWTNMLAHNLRTGSITEAWTKTFDGKHPCQLCQQISAGKKAEKKAEFPTLAKKLEFVSARLAFSFSSPTNYYLVNSHFSELTTWSEAPPTPPPLAA